MISCEDSIRSFLLGLGLDLTSPDLKDTPRRVAQMYQEELLCNINREFEDFFTSPNINHYNQIIVSDRIHFVSVCCHHLLPFEGHAWVMYIPQHYLIGASKMARIVEHYSKRPQLQEHLCHEVAEAFDIGVSPRGVMVVMKATHGCMSCRGVQQYDGNCLITSVVKGAFEDPSVKMEALALINLSERR